MNPLFNLCKEGSGFKICNKIEYYEHREKIGSGFLDKRRQKHAWIEIQISVFCQEYKLFFGMDPWSLASLRCTSDSNSSLGKLRAFLQRHKIRSVW
jgi:hypothetical protein